MAKTTGHYAATYGEPVEVEIEIDDYSDNPRNYNGHSQQQLDSIAKSLKKFGQVKRVSVWRNIYVTGHATKTAAKSIGWTTLKALKFPDGWPAEAVQAWMVADNETARMSDPDDVQLARLVEEAADFDKELALAMGYDEERFRQLLGIDSQEFDVPDDFTEYGDDIETEFRCPSCGYEWSGSPS